MTYRPFPHYLIPYLEREEGERFNAYRDTAGVLTVGVGHVVKPGEPTALDQMQINADLASDLITSQERLTWAIGSDAINKLSDCQYAALLSFVFNEGEKSGWTVWADIRNGDLSEVPNQLRQFDLAGGKVEQGLINRRKADIDLWNGTDPIITSN